MGRIIAKVIAQFLLLLGPVITLNWSVLSFLGYGQNIDINILFLHIAGQKEQVEFKLRVLVTLCGLAMVLGSEIFDYYLPRRDFREFRDLYLQNEAIKNWRNVLIPDVRINILHIYRLGRFLWLIPVFKWTWNDGFKPPNCHFDVNLFFTKYQGVCGRAFRKKEPIFVDFREKKPLERNRFYHNWIPFRWNWFQLHNWPPFNQFHLWPWQLVKSNNLKGVLSVPILKESKGNSPKWHAVGVINLDSCTATGADFLKEHRNQLTTYFVDYGKILACLK